MSSKNRRSDTRRPNRAVVSRQPAALGSRLSGLVAALAAVVLLAAACGSDDIAARGGTVDEIVAGEIAVGSPVEIESFIISAIEGSNSPSFSFYVSGADSRAEPLFVTGVEDLDGADAGDLVRIIGTVGEVTSVPVLPDYSADVVVVATDVTLLEEGQLDEGDFDDKTDAPDPTDVERDEPVTEDPDGLVGPDSDIPSGGEGVPQYPATS
ncbi:MAG: hypothetical protein RIE08_12095 [Acidimicrobiales bacterium]